MPSASPILAFGDRLAELRSGLVGIVAATRGGVPISWMAPGHSSGFFEATVSRARAAGPVKGVLYWQGETETMSQALADSWPAAFIQWVFDIRVALNQPDLPIVLVMLGATPQNDPNFPYWEYLRAKQATMTLPVYVTRVDISDLPGGAVHYPTATIVAAGVRAANAMNALLNN